MAMKSSCKGTLLSISISVAFLSVVAHFQPLLAAEKTQNAKRTLSPIVSQQKPTSLNAETVFNLVNQRRNQSGLPDLVKDRALCTIARERAPQLHEEIMVTGRMHEGFYSRKLPFAAVENIIYMNTEYSAVEWWMNSPIHRASIMGSYTHTCVACWGNSCTQIFAAF